MRAVERILSSVDRLCAAVGRLAGWLAAALVLLVGFDVTTRYLLDFSLVAVQEAQWHLFAAVLLLGAPLTLQRDRHVRVDVLYTTLTERRRAWIDLVGFVLFLVPFCWLGLRLGWDYAAASFTIGEGSPQPGGLPARWVLKGLVPLTFALLLVQGAAKAVRSLRLLRGGTPPAAAAPGASPRASPGASPGTSAGASGGAAPGPSLGAPAESGD